MTNFSSSKMAPKIGPAQRFRPWGGHVGTGYCHGAAPRALVPAMGRPPDSSLAPPPQDPAAVRARYARSFNLLQAICIPIFAGFIDVGTACRPHLYSHHRSCVEVQSIFPHGGL